MSQHKEYLDQHACNCIQALIGELGHARLTARMLSYEPYNQKMREAEAMLLSELTHCVNRLSAVRLFIAAADEPIPSSKPEDNVQYHLNLNKE